MKLEMTPSQAWILKRILENVGGDPMGPRGEMDKLLWKLEDMVKKPGHPVKFDNDRLSGEGKELVSLGVEWA